MRRVHRQGREHREDGALEVVVDPGLLLLIQSPVVEEMDAGLGQLVLQVVPVVGLLLLQQRCEFFAHQRQLLGGG